MMLIGQYDSPFVRRIGIALSIYGMPFDHQPWSTFSDGHKIAAYNPLMRVPALVLDNGDTLIDSHVIIDYLDGLMPSEQRLYPQAEPDRHQAMRITALAAGFSDKAISLFYEQVLHSEVSPLWVERCTKQMSNTLQVLESDRQSLATPYWFGERIGHADIAVATSLRHFTDAHPTMANWKSDFPQLARHLAELEEMPVFQEISQPFIAPA